MKKGAVLVKGTVSKKGGETKTISAKAHPVGDPVAEPCAMVGVTVGYTMSKNYQSVKIDAHVSLPWDPEDAELGLAAAYTLADKFLASSHKDVEDALDTLQ